MLTEGLSIALGIFRENQVPSYTDKGQKHSCNQNELRTLNGGGRRDVMVSRVMAKFKDKWGWRISHSGKES